MILKGSVTRLEEREMGTLKVASITCGLQQPDGKCAALSISVPIAEAEYWPLGMPVAVTVEKGESDDPDA